MNTTLIFHRAYDRGGLSSDANTHRGNFRGKAVLQFDPVQRYIANPNNPGQQINQCIARCWVEDQKAFEFTWPALRFPINQVVSCSTGPQNGNQKRENACPMPSGSSSATGKNDSASSSRPISPASSADNGKNSSTFSITRGPSLSSSSSSSSGAASSSAASGSSAPSPLCYPFEDPDAGPGHVGCQCSGSTGLVPFMSNTASDAAFNICGYTKLPSNIPSSSVKPFTTTDFTNGNVLSCASSTYFNYAVDTRAECAGPSTAVSTISSIYASYQSSLTAASASSASMASASETSASAALAPAKPSSGCKIWDAVTFYLVEVYGIDSK